MDLRQLQTLIAVAETGSFAGAAARVNLTASAVSQQIQALESNLGVSLFDRSTRPPSLNAKGEEMLRAARQTVQIMAEAKAAISGGRRSGVLKIGAIRTVSMRIVPRALESMKADYPDLSFSLTVGLPESLIADVASGRLDAALVAEHVGVPAGFTWTEILSEPLVLVAPHDAPPGATADLLRALPFVRYETAVPLARQIGTELARMRITPRDIVQCNTMPAVIGCVRAGLGCAIVPKMAVLDLPASAVTVLPFGAEAITRRLGLVRRQVSSRAAVLAALGERLIAQGHADGLGAGHGDAPPPPV